jgi:hypothetical protein
LAAAVAVVMAACGSGGGSSDSSPPTTPVTRPSSTAQLVIASPTPGETVTGPTVHVKLNLQGAKITKVVSTNLKPDEGHIHLRLDGRTITLLGSLEQDIPGVTPGPHLLEAEFVAADHGPFFPRVISSVTFTVTA